MAELNDLSIYKGEDAIITFSMTSTSAANTISGWTMALSVKTHQTDAANVITKTPTTATTTSFTVTLASTDTSSLGARDYYYDVQRTDASNVGVLSIGLFSVLQEVRIP